LEINPPYDIIIIIARDGGFATGSISMLIASFPIEASSVTAELSVGGISYSTQNEGIPMFISY